MRNEQAVFYNQRKNTVLFIVDSILSALFYLCGAFLLLCNYVAGFEWHPVLILPAMAFAIGALFTVLAVRCRHVVKHCKKIGKTNILIYSIHKNKRKDESLRASSTAFGADRGQWHWEEACKVYCDISGRKEEDLTKEEAEIIWSYAVNHIAIYVTWLVERDFYDYANEYTIMNVASQMKLHKTTGRDFLHYECDEALTEEDIKEEARAFTDNCYDLYLENYHTYMAKNNKPMYSTEFKWTDYEVLKKELDRLYDVYIYYSEHPGAR